MQCNGYTVIKRSVLTCMFESPATTSCCKKYLLDFITLIFTIMRRFMTMQMKFFCCSLYGKNAGPSVPSL